MSNPNIPQLHKFLSTVDKLFPVPLSQKQNLQDFAIKLSEKANIHCIMQEDIIVSMVVGYTKNLTDNIAYISVVATLPEYQGKGYAKKLLSEFIEDCKSKAIKAVHLYTSVINTSAISMYKNFGFEEWVLSNESRPNDLHLIYTLMR